MKARSLQRVICLGLALLLLVQPMLAFATPAVSSVSTPEIKTARTQAAAAQVKLDALASDLESTSEDYYAAKEKTQTTTAKIKATQEELTQAEAKLELSREQLGERSAAVYRSGDISILSLLVGAGSFQDFVTRLDLMHLVTQNDAKLVRTVREAKAQIEQTKITLEAQRAEEKEAEAQELKNYKKMQGALADQKSYLASLNGKVQELVAAEQERRDAEERVRATEEAKRIAEEARRQREQEKVKVKPPTGGDSGGNRGNTGSGNTGGSGGNTGGTTRPPSSSLGSSHPSVVSEARKYIGVTPYVWGGSTPAGFDCSGLTQYCYRVAAGISIPRTSRSQFSAGDYIPPDRKDLLKPGDLVFFGTNANPNLIHHVGIYSGNSLMIHAPQTGQKVKESYAFRSDYVGAVRP